MHSVPSVTIDIETAATLREWLFENAVEKHGESDISEPLADLAAAIDGELHEHAASIELGASARTLPPTDRGAWFEDDAVDDHQLDDAHSPAEDDPVDEDTPDPERLYETLPDSAWQLAHDRALTTQDRPPTTASHDRETLPSNPPTRRQHSRPSVRYRAVYECTVCGGVCEVDTARRVCAFVDACATCGTVARLTAVGIPTPLEER